MNIVPVPPELFDPDEGAAISDSDTFSEMVAKLMTSTPESRHGLFHWAESVLDALDEVEFRIARITLH